MSGKYMAAFLWAQSFALIAHWAQRDRLKRLYEMDRGLTVYRRFVLWVDRVKEKRSKGKYEGWPEFIEGLAIAVSSGVSLMTAFDAAAIRARGRLARELEQVSLTARSGVSLSTALLTSPEGEFFRKLADSLNRSEILGTPVSSVLMSLAKEERTGERVRILAHFNTLPLKLSIVTVMFLLPPVIVVTVVPNILAFVGARW